MRPDLSKVITENGRHGGGIKAPKGERKKFQKTDWEDQPKSEKIRLKWKMNWQDGKEFSERLGPLYRWLNSQVGRPWNKVYSEMCEQLDRGNVVQNHVFTHAEQYVETNVIMKGKVPCHGEGGWRYGEPIHPYFNGGLALWVHPVTGILMKLQRKNTRIAKKEPIIGKGIVTVVKKGIVSIDWSKSHKHVIRLDTNTVAKKINDIWYKIALEPFVPQYIPRVIHLYGKNKWYTTEFRGPYDIIFGRAFSYERDYKEMYGGLFVAKNKKQMNKKEIKRMLEKR